MTFGELKKILKTKAAFTNSIKIVLIGDTATQFLATAIKGMGVVRGYSIDLLETEYNQVERQFMDPASELYEFDADIIVVFQSTHKLGEYHSMLAVDQQLTLAEDRLEFVASICENPALAVNKTPDNKYLILTVPRQVIWWFVSSFIVIAGCMVSRQLMIKKAKK